MIQRLFVFLLLAPTLCGVISSEAGQNAGATAKLYWIDASNNVLATQVTSSCTPRFLVTTKGVKGIRGANVQIQVAGVEGIPPSWQAQSGGCADSVGAFSYHRDAVSFPASKPSVWTGMSGLADAEHSMRYHYDNCLTPHGIAVIWLETAGTSEAIRNATTEYGLYVVSLDQSTGLCLGDCANSTQELICLSGYLVNPCPNPTTSGPFIQLLDGNLAVDNCSYVVGFDGLAWLNGYTGPCTCPALCSDAVQTTSWGRLKKSYR